MGTNLYAGIDVGGPTKGFHAVALSSVGVVAKLRSTSADEIATWCAQQDAAVVAIDAPCRWRLPGQPARAAERQLAAGRISSFSTPTEEQGQSHSFYTWMLAGHRLYAALADRYPVYDGSHGFTGAIETFPQAVACALAGEIVSAKAKLSVRTELLRRAGVDPARLQGIDEVDAALCALTARCFASGEFRAYGDALGGFIVVPSVALRKQEVDAIGRSTVKLKPSTGRSGRTTGLGYLNRNRQCVEMHTGLPGNDHLQRIYVLHCRDCDHRYGCNGSDIFQRRCPNCQQGRPGLAI